MDRRQTRNKQTHTEETDTNRMTSQPANQTSLKSALTFRALFAGVQSFHIGVCSIITGHREEAGDAAWTVVTRGAHATRAHHAVIVASVVEGNALVVEARVCSVHPRQAPVTR